MYELLASTNWLINRLIIFFHYKKQLAILSKDDVLVKYKLKVVVFKLLLKHTDEKTLRGTRLWTHLAMAAIVQKNARECERLRKKYRDWR